jgi:hypothetical protein
MGFAENALVGSAGPHESRWFLASFSKLSSDRVGDFKINYQGIEIVYLGKFRPISELSIDWLDSVNSLASSTLSKA